MKDKKIVSSVLFFSLLLLVLSLIVCNDCEVHL